MMWLDGDPVDQADLGALALVNYGHFTTMLVHDTGVRGLRLHLDRLVRDCRTLFGTELDPATVRALARQAAATAATPVVIRITVFDPELRLARPAGSALPRVLVTLRSVPPGRPGPVRLRTVRYARELPTVKHTGLFGVVRQRRAVQLDGYDDALFLNHAGQITEGATWNIAFLDGQQLIWPAGDRLAGVTMRLLDAALDRAGIASRTDPVTPADLPGRYAAVITNAVVGLRPVESINGTALAAAPDLIETLRRAYEAVEPEPL